MNIKEIQKPEDTNRILNTWYPKWFEGNAYLTRSGKNIVLMNSRENTDQAQWYGLNVKDAIENFPLSAFLVLLNFGSMQCSLMQMKQ